MKKKIKLKTTNKNMLSKAKHKTRLTQNLNAKHISNANKNKKREKKVIESLGAIFFPHLRRIILSSKPLIRW